MGVKKEYENPLAPEGAINKAECVKTLLRHGDYLYDPHRSAYYAYNGKYWFEVPRVVFQKKLIMFLGEDALSQRTQEEILSIFTTRISTTGFNNYELPKGLINLENGVLDIQNKKLLSHSKDYHFFNMVPIKYNPEDNCPLWYEFLLEVLLQKRSLIELVQEMFGYCLVPGNWLQSAFILLGEGENGKSVLLEVLRSMLGSRNTSALSLTDINDKFRRIELLNKYANICDESPSGKAIESDTFKNLVAGGTVTAEQKFKPAFSFVNKAKLVFAANSVPVVKDHTHAFYRRMVVIPFNFRVTSAIRDTQLVSKLLKELPGILNWAIEGYERVIQRGELIASQESLDAKHQFIREGSNVQLFIDECCDIGVEHKVVTEEMFNAYKDFCDNNGYHPCASNEFGKRLKTLLSSVDKTRETTGPRGYYYQGIQLRRRNNQYHH